MQVLNKFKGLNPTPLLFFDIECVRGEKTLPESGVLFDAWAYQRRKEGETTHEQLSASYESISPLYAEFNKVICVSFGFVYNDVLNIKSFSGADEKELLLQVHDFLSLEHFNKYTLCGYASNGYDIPVLSRRMLSHRIPLPLTIDFSDKKPWEVSPIDLQKVWNMNGFYTASLTTACYCLGIETSKSDNIDGSKISEIFWGKGKEKAKLATISSYCNEDVLATCNIARVLMGEDIITEYVIK